MAIRKILQEPDPILRQISQPVETVGIEEQQLMDDMLETMYDAPGIGLAAIQIGVPKNIIVMDISREKENKNPMYFVNPVIKNQNSNLSTYEEGCLSVPGFYEEIERPSKAKVQALDIEGKEYSLEVDKLLSVTIQHEMDHLEGRIFIDYLSNLKRQRIRNKLIKKMKERLV